MGQQINSVFIYDKLKIFFKHTDTYGNVHPYNFYEWTSFVREAYFSEVCQEFRRILDSSVKMMTAKISLKLYDDCVFGDDIEGRLTIVKIKRVSFDVICRFFNKRIEGLVGETRHTLVFVDAATNQFVSIPKGLADVIVKYEEREV